MVAHLVVCGLSGVLHQHDIWLPERLEYNLEISLWVFFTRSLANTLNKSGSSILLEK